MAQLGWKINFERCTFCRACVNACKFENNTTLDLSVNYRWVVLQEAGAYPEPTAASFPMACLHCTNPACLAACPVGAITKRTQDGVVLINQEKCIGCRYCIWACPYGVPQYNRVSGKVEKCTFCAHRIDVGLPPACATTCVGRVIEFGFVDQEIQPLGKPPEGFADARLTNPNVEFHADR